MDNDLITILKESIIGERKKRQEINTDFLKIKDNSIYYCDTGKKEKLHEHDKKTVLQISSIAQVDAGPAPKIKIPLITYAFLLAGLWMIPIRGGLMSGMVSLAIGCVIIYAVLTLNMKAGDNLIIHLNNGKYYLFNFQDKDFLNRVFTVLMDCITNKGEGETMININSGTISTVIGDGNTMTNTSTGSQGNTAASQTTTLDFDWPVLQESLLELLKKLPASSEEYQAASHLLGSVLNRDKSAFINCVKSFSLAFCSALFANTASPYLQTLINSLLKP